MPLIVNGKNITLGNIKKVEINDNVNNIKQLYPLVPREDVYTEEKPKSSLPARISKPWCKHLQYNANNVTCYHQTDGTNTHCETNITDNTNNGIISDSDSPRHLKYTDSNYYTSGRCGTQTRLLKIETSEVVEDGKIKKASYIKFPIFFCGHNQDYTTSTFRTMLLSNYPCGVTDVSKQKILPSYMYVGEKAYMVMYKAGGGWTSNWQTNGHYDNSGSPEVYDQDGVKCGSSGTLMEIRSNTINYGRFTLMRVENLTSSMPCVLPPDDTGISTKIGTSDAPSGIGFVYEITATSPGIVTFTSYGNDAIHGTTMQSHIQSIEILEKPQYVIEFNNNGQTGFLNQAYVTKGDSYTLPESLKFNFRHKGEEIFNGWGLNKDDDVIDYEDGATITNVTGNITLYAKYKRKAWFDLHGIESWNNTHQIVLVSGSSGTTFYLKTNIPPEELEITNPSRRSLDWQWKNKKVVLISNNNVNGSIPHVVSWRGHTIGTINSNLSRNNNVVTDITWSLDY